MAFLVAAPVLVAALYIYLHLYLMSLWDALGAVEAAVGGAPVAQRVFPTFLAHAALWLRALRRDDCSMPPRALGGGMAAGGFLLTWGFGFLILLLLWWRSTAYHDVRLTLWIALWLGLATAAGYGGLVVAKRRMEGRDDAHAPGRCRCRCGAARGALQCPGRNVVLFTEGLERPIR